MGAGHGDHGALHVAGKRAVMRTLRAFFKRLGAFFSKKHWEGELAAELEAVFRSRPLSDWLDLFEGEDVMAGPVATLAEASEWLGEEVAPGSAPALGEHTERWRADLASFEG